MDDIRVRWCVVEGSPVLQPNTDVDAVLSHRLDLASGIWESPSNNTLIEFRPTLDDRFQKGQFQIIADPCPSGPNCVGELGDIVDSLGFEADEEQKVIDACRAAWAKNLPAARGIITINIRRFVGSHGGPVGTLGYTKMPYGCTASAQACTNPFLAQPDKIGLVGVILTDASFTGASDDALVAHEFGHALGLGHGDGLDNNRNCVIDECCDPVEPRPKPNLMNDFNQDRTITNFQKIIARAVAYNNIATDFLQPPTRAIVVSPSGPVQPSLPAEFCKVGRNSNTIGGPPPK